jgi:Yip1 domain
MTESTASAAPAPKTSFWEDVFDIFVSPAAVFRRRENSSFWPPMLLVAISIAIIVFATFNTLQPIFDAEYSRAIAKAVAKNPQAAQATTDAMNKFRSVGENFGRYGIGVIMIVTMFVVGTIAWVLGKLFGSKQTYNAALVVAAWSFMPRVLGTLINGIQGLLMDPESLKSQLSVSLSPARFMDPDTPNQLLYQFAGRLDLITIWVTVLLAIGLYVTGKVSKGSAATFGVLIWFVGGLYAFRQALM